MEFSKLIQENFMDRVKGSLFGFCIGDALGAPLEGSSRRSRGNYVTNYLFGVGIGTDDTDMMMCVLEVIVSVGEYDPDSVAKKYLSWYLSNPRGIGKVTSTALKYLSLGYHWSTTGKLAHLEIGYSCTNGALMRVLPIALRYYKDVEKMIRYVLIDCRMTHWDKLTQNSCIAYALLIKNLLEFMDDKVKIVKRTVDELRRRNVMHEVIKVIENALSKGRDNVKSSGFVLDTIESTIWSFVSTSSFKDALIEAINLGGDTDTIGALVGGLAGLYYGYNSIPNEWIEKLVVKDKLEELSKKLIELMVKL